MSTDLTQELQSRAAIADMIHRYAYNVRKGKAADCASLFTPDAEFEVREASPFDLAGYTVRSRAVGLNDVLAYISGSTGSVRVTPLIHNLLIDLHGANATSNCMMTNHIFPGGAQMIGEYDDSFRFDGSWRFTRRVYTILLDRDSSLS